MTINTFINAITKPKETFAAEKANASIGKAALYFLIAGFIGAVLSYIFEILFSTAIGGATGGAYAGVTGLLGLVIGPIFTLIFSFIFVVILFILAKLFGGNGPLTQLFYLMSLFAIPITIFESIPFIGLLAMLYGIYLGALAIKESQQLSMGKAVAVILIPIIIAIVLAFLIVALVGLAIFSAFQGVLPTGAFGL